jgi:hypothetical protein
VAASVTGYLATAAGFQPRLFASPAQPQTHNVQMVQDTGVVLQGTVTDRNTGGPLVGASVSGGCGDVTLTDANGAYSLNGEQVCHRANGQVTVGKTGYFQNFLSFTIPSSPTTLDVTLLPGGTVFQGTVTDAHTQAAIAGASVRICFSQANPFQFFCEVDVQTVTGSNGQYSVDSSQFHEAYASGLHVYLVIASAAGYLNHRAISQDLPLVSLPPFPGTHNAELILDTGVILQGTVTDRTMALPLAGVSVSGGCGATLTDANGNYSLNAQSLCNNAFGGVSFQAIGYFSLSSTYTITAIPTVLDTALTPGGTLLQGTVTDASTQAVVAGAAVSICFGRLSSSNGCDVAFLQTTTGLDGRYGYDSSRFSTDVLAAGFNVGIVEATAAGYFDYNANGEPLFTFNQPFPGTLDVAMTSRGILRSITIATDPPGLGIAVDGAPLISPRQFNWKPSNPHTIGTSTPQGSGGTRHAFVGWSDGGAISHTIVVSNADTTYTASFSTEYQLTTSASPSSGGSVTVGGWFAPGQQVVITATPNSGFNFTGFTGDLSGTTNPQTIVINGPKTVTATFALAVGVPDITATPSVLSFGSIALGDTSANQTVTVKNDGAATLSLGTISNGGSDANQFSKTADKCSKKNLAPGAQCTVAARFKPTSNGPKAGFLVIPSNDPDENPFSVSLSGTGGLGGDPDVAADPSALDFGTVAVKTPRRTRP